MPTAESWLAAWASVSLVTAYDGDVRPATATSAAIEVRKILLRVLCTVMTPYVSGETPDGLAAHLHLNKTSPAGSTPAQSLCPGP